MFYQQPMLPRHHRDVTWQILARSVLVGTINQSRQDPADVDVGPVGCQVPAGVDVYSSVVFGDAVGRASIHPNMGVEPFPAMKPIPQWRPRPLPVELVTRLRARH